MLESLGNINMGKVSDNDFKESNSITIIREILEKNKRVKVRAQEADKTPNLDGKLMILDNNSMERITIDIQAKTLPIDYKYDFNIIYTVRSFNWQSEAKIQAGVHCVIIEITIGELGKEKYIRSGNILTKVNHINGYLMDVEDVWIEPRKNPICNVPNISNDSKPLDNAICAFTPEEKDEFVKKEPNSEHYFYRYMGSKEFINNIER